MPGDVEKLGDLDKKLLRHAASGISPDENSKRIGGVLSPAKVVLRIHELLASPDSYLSIPQQIQLQLREMRGVYDELRDRYLDDKNAKVLLDYSMSIIRTLKDLQAQNDVDVNTYNAAVGRAMGQAFDIAIATMGGMLCAKYNIPAEEWAAAKRDALEAAQAEVIKRQVES